MPTISIIVPTYNAERTVLETVKSVQQQTFSDFELIVINDGSADQTLELLRSVVDDRLKVFSYDNSGVSVARNRGIAHATGEFIAFLDADDLWASEKLELQLAALRRHPEAGAAYSWAYCIDAKGELLYPQKPVFFEGNVYLQLLVNNFLICGSILLVRRQAIETVGKFDPLLKSVGDYEYWLRLAAQWPFALVPRYQVLYRHSPSSISSNVALREESGLIVIERAFQSAAPELQSLKNQRLADVYLGLAGLCLSRIPESNWARQASQKLVAAIRLHPKTLQTRKFQCLATRLVLTRLLSRRGYSRLKQLLHKILPIPATQSSTLCGKDFMVGVTNAREG